MIRKHALCDVPLFSEKLNYGGLLYRQNLCGIRFLSYLFGCCTLSTRRALCREPFIRLGAAESLHDIRLTVQAVLARLRLAKQFK